MTHNQRYRLFAALGTLGAAGLFIFFILKALSSNMHAYVTPTELVAQPLGRTVRLGGFVVPGSIQRDETGQGNISFQVRDEENSITLHYTGVLPDLFREGQGVVALGQNTGTHFEATQILAKHDESYRPRTSATQGAS
ncbi:MAG: cytochrome c maturation protein CcmE [Pseudomonadota bacterium]